MCRAVPCSSQYLRLIPHMPSHLQIPTKTPLPLSFFPHCPFLFQNPWIPLAATPTQAASSSPALARHPGESCSCSHLDERHPNSLFLHVALELVTDFANELVGHHEQEDIGPCTGFEQVWLCHLNKRDCY